MKQLETIIIIIILLFVIYFFIRFFQEILLKPQKKYRRRRSPKRKNNYLTKKTKAKADRKYKKLLSQFKHENKRKPTHNDLFRIVINASHITIKYRKGHSGHWGRQKVRKYLLEKHDIVDNYIMK